METSKQLHKLYDILGYMYEMQGMLLFYCFPNQQHYEKITYEQRMKHNSLRPGEVAKKKLEDLINELIKEESNN